MGYEKISNALGFVDLTLAGSLKYNRSPKLMNKLNDAFDWARVELILMAHYNVGTSGEGAETYPLLLPFKCILLQKWFRINFDTELGEQINDRPSPDHSTFSSFRSRLSKNTMDRINSEILSKFEAKGLAIMPGISRSGSTTSLDLFLRMNREL